MFSRSAKTHGEIFYFNFCLCFFNFTPHVHMKGVIYTDNFLLSHSLLLVWIWCCLTFSPVFYLFSFLFPGSITVSCTSPLSSASCETFLQQHIFFLQTPSYSIPPTLILLCPSHTCPPWARSHSWEYTEKAEKNQKQVTAVSVDETQADLEHSLFFLLHPSCAMSAKCGIDTKFCSDLQPGVAFGRVESVARRREMCQQLPLLR